jgi:transcriptional regulator with GAF, ATPase, and Fis domain
MAKLKKASGTRAAGDLPGLQARDVNMEHREEWLARTFVELVDTLVADFDLIDFMSVLVERCAELLDSAEVGLALAAGQGELRVLASSSERMRALELIEVQNDEGPCRDCLRSGEQVLNQRLDGAESRWPRFAPEAREAGFRMVHALPLRLRSDVIGAMNIFSSEFRELSPQDVNLTQALADVATIVIL